VQRNCNSRVEEEHTRTVTVNLNVVLRFSCAFIGYSKAWHHVQTRADHSIYAGTYKLEKPPDEKLAAESNAACT
jgi:hypothetical protein